MIEILPTGGMRASITGPLVYLDNWAIGDLAEGDSRLRDRFIAVVHSGVDLLFTVTNAAELSGPQGQSAEAVRYFLDKLGPRWFPAKLDPTEVIKCELEGKGHLTACASEAFVKSFATDRMRAYPPGTIIPLSAEFFCLGGMLDWVGPQRESIQKGSIAFDDMLRNKLAPVFERSKLDAAWFDQKFPRIPFDPARPAWFVYMNLLRIMASEAKAVKKGDGMDFCHAVIAGAYARFAALDKRWKIRLSKLPQPNQLGRFYFKPELERMVDDIEAFIATNK